LITLADVSFYQEDYDNSLQFYKKISELYPDQGLLLFSRAQDLERELHFEHSIRYYQTMIELFPRNPNFRYAIMHISQMQSQINQPDQAIANLQKLISQYRENNDFIQDSLWLSAYILMGDIYIQQKKDVQRGLYVYIESKRLMETWTGGMGSRLLETELKIADCYRLIEKYDDAGRILDFAQLREQTKTALAQVAKLRGDVFFSRGDFEKALIQYQEAILWPMNEDWINDSLEKIALIKEYLDQDNTDALRIYAQVERLKELGQYDEALKLCVSYTDDRLKLAAGELFTLQLKFSEAILTYEQLVKSKSNLTPEAIYRIAGIYLYNLGDREQAIKKYSELIEGYPDSIFVAEARKQIRLLASGKTTDRHIP
ncbi:tetratricopeptide repeat protein, partial [Candidatus Poribacteria bacterium]|nr:tetratricopeptide repeat protein [Candidatus Poribacteria bacterium]